MKKKLFHYIGVFVLLIASFFVFSVISSWWPDKTIKKNISKAAVYFNEAGLYPNAIINKTACRQDNFTETLVLNQIYCIDRSKPVRSAMSAYRGYTKPSYDLPKALFCTTNNAQESYDAYPRYWHGNTFLFRILFSFMSYTYIQWLMFAVSMLLLVFFICVYYPRAGIWQTIAFIMSWILVYGFMMQFSMQFFPTLAISLIASILIVRHPNDIPYIALLFFITACCTNYFDLFTIPMLTFGWPLVVWLSIQDNQSINLKDTSLSIMKWGTLWVTGYGLTFISKWGISSLILKSNILKDGFGQSFYRMNADGFNRWDAITKNFEMLPLAFVVVCILIFILVSIPRFQAKGWLKSFYFILIALLPYIWYLAASNHSYLHFWFTYRLQAITLASLFMAVLSFRSQKGKALNDHFNNPIR